MAIEEILELEDQGVEAVNGDGLGPADEFCVFA